jgi:hypothetical protein
MAKKKLDPVKEQWNKQMEETYKIEKQKLSKTEEKKDEEPKKNLIEKYKRLQKEFLKIDNDETLKKWKVLSKAYKIGKEIYGQDFSVLKLSQHFEIPYTTCKRVLSLDKSTQKTWKLIREKKISAFKVAQINLTRNIKYQDQIVDAVITDNLSTSQIKDIRVTEKGLNVKELRLEKAIKEGYARVNTAYKSLRDTTKRMIRLLDIDKKNLPESRISEIIEFLDELQAKINKVIQNLIENEK